MKNKILFFVGFMLLSIFSINAQTTINFDTDLNWIQDGTTSLSSYGNHGYAESGALFSGTKVLRNGVSAQDGIPGALDTYSLRIRNQADAKVNITIATGGISTFSFSVRRWDNNPMPDYTVKYSTDGGTIWNDLPNIDGTLLTSSDWFTYNGTVDDASDNIQIEIANTGTTERIMIDNFSWSAYSTGSTDQTSTVTAPTTQLSGGTISSVATDSTAVMQFVITDAGGDGLPTNVTGLKFFAGPNNTISFQDNLGGGAISDKTNGIQIPFAGAPIVSASEVYLPIALTVPEGSSITLEVALYLEPTNSPDGAIAQFQINANAHGFTTNTSGSGFEPNFAGGDIVGNNFTIDVSATQLSWTIPPVNVTVDEVMTPNPQIGVTDIFGNIDIDYASFNCQMTFNGTGTMSGTYPIAVLNGLADLTDYSFNTAQTGASITAHMETSAFPDTTCAPFDIQAGPIGTLFISEYIEGGGYNKSIEIYNGTGFSVDLSNYTLKKSPNGGGWGSPLALVGTLANGDVYVVSHTSADAAILAETDLTDGTVPNFNGNDAIGLFKDDILIDIVGDAASNLNQSVAGIDNATVDHTLVRKFPDVIEGNTNWASSAGTNTVDSEWIVFDQDDFSYIGWHGAIDMPPVISNIGITPTSPTPTDIVTVAATITDDVGVTGAELYWALTSPVTIGDNVTTMVNTAGDVYSGTMPPQTAGTTVYYMIGANDGSKVLVTSPEQQYTVSSNSGGADCANAVSITPGTHHAIHTQEGDGDIYDQWYSFVAPFSGTANVENCASDVDIYFLIQEGTCGNDYDMADNDDCGDAGYSENFTFNITAGETYFIGIGNWDQALIAEYDWTLSVSDVTPVNSIALLRTGTVGNKYELTSEAVLTFQQSYRNQKYIQDNTGAILIDDDGGAITSTYNLYDGVSGITGTLGEYNGMLQFIPNADPGAATSTGNTVTPQVITLAQFNSNFEDYEAELVTINNATFTDAGGTFATGTLYEMTDGSAKASANFRTNFYDADYIGGTIPTNANITALCVENSSGITFTARNLADIDVIVGLNEINENLISVYPNPSSGLFNIYVNENVNIEVLDIAGKVLQTKNVYSNTTISISDAGVYFLRFSNKNGSIVRRIIVE